MRIGMMMAATAAWLALTGMQAPPKPPAPLELYRLDCGSIAIKNLDLFSDTYLYPGQTKTLTASCYLIRNGDRLLLWDTGLEKSADDDFATMTLKARIVPQLAQIGVKPDAITHVGISHYHFDHIGQAADFPKATLLIGKKDYAVAKAYPPITKLLAPWTSGGGKVEELSGDKDVFGDGRVTILSLPGHTEGHQALLVRLASGPVLLSGDQYHFTEQVANRGVPAFNTDRSQTLASMDRFDRLAENVKAKVIIQHEPADIAKLPAFPQPAK